MADPSLDVAVIGAGHAGLSVSYFLRQHGIRHIVLERGRIGESWRTQRWNSFVLNSPNRFNTLLGDTYTGTHPDGFDSASGFVSYLEGYANRFRLPVEEHARVLSVERDSTTYHLTASVRGAHRRYACRQVVVASGAMNEPRLPPIAGKIPSSVRQYHAGTYRAPAELPRGAVLVVGSGQSGLQVAEDLIEGGRRVYLSTSAVGRVPRRYRGRDILEWMLRVGFYDMKTDDITDPKDLELKQPQVSGVGPLGHTHSLQSLSRRGVLIIGRIDDAVGNVITLQPNAADHVRFADEVSRRIKGLIEQFIAEHRLTVPPMEPDPADEPDTEAACASSVRELDLTKEGIRSIIWATGFTADFSYLRDTLRNGATRPVHRNGIADVAGLTYVGLPWLRKRKSGIINGITEDAAFIAKHVKSGGSA